MEPDKKCCHDCWITGKVSTECQSSLWHESADGALHLPSHNPILRSVCVCVFVFSSHSFWTSSSLDVPAGVTQEEGHTGFLTVPYISRATTQFYVVCMCVCVFFPFIVDIKFVGRTSRGHTGFLIHLLSAVRALIFRARWI